MFFNKTKKELEEAQNRIEELESELNSRMEAIGEALNNEQINIVQSFFSKEWFCNGQYIPFYIAQRIINLRKKSEVKTEEFAKVYASRLAYWREQAKKTLESRPPRINVEFRNSAKGWTHIKFDDIASAEKEYANAQRAWSTVQECVCIKDVTYSREEIHGVTLDRGKTYTDQEMDDWAVDRKSVV